MGAKYNWEFGKYWVEFTPFIYIRVNKKSPEGFWETKYEKWWC